MSMSDPLADLFTTIRNAYAVGLLEITYRPSKLNKEILHLLSREGYLVGFFELSEHLKKKENVYSKKNKLVSIRLKYEDGEACIKKIERVSTPGRRKYVTIKELTKPYNGLGLYILSTSKGILSDQEAKLLNVGGEIIGKVI